jgi:hypothetical protein
LKTIHLWSNTAHARSGVVKETTLIVIQVLSKPRVTEKGHPVTGKGRRSPLNHFNETVCPLTSPISNRQHRQLKMETYLKTMDLFLEGGVAGVTIGRDIGIRSRGHCKVRRGVGVDER